MLFRGLSQTPVSSPPAKFASRTGVSQVENPLAKDILGGKHAAGDTVRVSAIGGEITFSNG